MTDEAEAIVEKVTEAQRRAVLSLRTDGTFADAYIVCRQRRTRMKLNNLGVTEPRIVGPITEWWRFRLTPLGLAVRNLLNREASEAPGRVDGDPR